MENEDIEELRKLKEDLLKQALQLRDRLKNQEENGRQSSINLDVLSTDGGSNTLSRSQTMYEAKLCEISGQVTGITFEDVSKKWLYDDVYLYTAKVVTKAVSFNLELRVSLKGSDDFKIEDIMGYFLNVKDCYMLEISPWFQKITHTKNFSLLMSALSHYNDYNIFRSKILHSLESKKYVKVEECNEENGGVLVRMCSPTNSKKIYLIFHWSIRFLEFTWHIEHFFVVDSTEAGVEFSEDNCVLLKEFCKIGLTKSYLVELWDKLCNAVETYHAKNMKRT